MWNGLSHPSRVAIISVETNVRLALYPGSYYLYYEARAHKNATAKLPGRESSGFRMTGTGKTATGARYEEASTSIPSYRISKFKHPYATIDEHYWTGQVRLEKWAPQPTAG